MTYKTVAALVALIGSGASVAAAETLTFGDVGLSFDVFSLSGDAVNSSGGYPNEPDAFHAGRLDASFGGVQSNGLTWSVQGHYLGTSLSDFLAPGEETNEGVDKAGQITATLGHYANDLYWGAIAGAGQMTFVGDSWDQDTNYQLLGAGIGTERGNWAYGGSVVFLNVTSVDDPETLDNAFIAKVQAEYALAAEQSFIGAYALYADGENDVDSGSSPDRVKGPGLGIYLRHKIGSFAAGNDVMLNAGLDYVALQENGSFGNENVSGLKAHFGVSIALGATPTPRAVRMARAADTTFVQMLTPYVD